jgi:hypothetical protein
MGAENLAPPGFDTRTFQPVASRYTDYAIPGMNTVRTPKEKVIDQGKMELLTPMKTELSWNGLHSVCAAEDKVCFGNWYKMYTH